MATLPLFSALPDAWRRNVRLSALCLGLAASLSPAHAAPYSNVVFFGDSLSDTGNVLALTQAFLPPPFPSYPGAAGRFSNGPVWTEALAGGLGRASDAQAANLFLAGPPLVPALSVIAIGPPGGQNYAYGGARTGLGGSAGPTTGLLGQLANWNGSFSPGGLTRSADADALYVVYAGANDLRDARRNFFGTDPASAAARAAAAQQVATGLLDAIKLLTQAGARHFLVGNLPDLGLAPEVPGLEAAGRPGLAAASTEITQLFNADLQAGLLDWDADFRALTGIDLDLRLMDVHGLTESIVDDARNNAGARFGITNITSPCIEPGALSGTYFAPDATDTDGNCSSSLFSDDLHPSAAAHRLFGQLALAAVPLPGSVPLTLLALAGVAMLRRRVAA